MQPQLVTRENMKEQQGTRLELISVTRNSVGTELHAHFIHLPPNISRRMSHRNVVQASFSSVLKIAIRKISRENESRIRSLV